MEDIGFTLDQKKRKKEMSSNINEVIRAVLNSFFFYKKISHAPKAQKESEAPKA